MLKIGGLKDGKNYEGLEDAFVAALEVDTPLVRLMQTIEHTSSLQEMFQCVHSLPLFTIDNVSARFVETRYNVDFFVMIGREECDSNSMMWPLWMVIKDSNGKFLRVSELMRTKLTLS